MTTKEASRPRHALIPFLLLGTGGAIAIVAQAGGFVGRAHAILLAALVLALAAYLLSRGRGDLAAIFRSERDERQTLIVWRAAALAGVVAILVCFALGARELLRRESPLIYLNVCILYSLAFLASLIWIKRRT